MVSRSKHRLARNLDQTSLFPDIQSNPVRFTCEMESSAVSGSALGYLSSWTCLIQLYQKCSSSTPSLEEALHPNIKSKSRHPAERWLAQTSLFPATDPNSSYPPVRYSLQQVMRLSRSLSSDLPNLAVADHGLILRCLNHLRW